jgi:hypothetical protein
MKTRFASILTAFLALSALAACAEPTPQCRGVASAQPATSEAVCARLRMINCPIEDCPGAYSAWQRSVEPAAFARVTACYVAATTCREVDECARACGSGGPISPQTDGSFDDAAMNYDVAGQ